MVDSLENVIPADIASSTWPRGLGPATLPPTEAAPVDPVPGAWPKDWRKAVEAFRASSPDAFAWTCDWHGSGRSFRKTCQQVLAVLELCHGQTRNVHWVLIPARGPLWPAFLEEFRALPAGRQARIAANLARHNEKVAAELTDRRVQDALVRAGGATVWNTLEPFDRRLSFDALADARRLLPDMVRAEFDGGLIVDVAFRRPGGCRVSVVDEGGRGSWSKTDVLYERQVADGAELDSAVREAVALLSSR